ncbi:MAG: ATP-dependent RNA helicase HrpA [endosymbiont of Galathealinum brachiosum]|uniref:ATP-dependent RNA helicase HrpA n=1 Tax=endosymbiont of Galathealinum brachiosum TaxID=2200906 RepID=A0A370DEH8_9GAMM|nr:MAG: ATP-dependent RNA helicase HrpA [endosymbiont of Galathealinum brachiosum]
MSPKKQVEQLKKSLQQIMLKDEFSARRKIQSLQSRLNSSKPVEKLLVNLQDLIDKSASQFHRRAQNKSTTTYPEELPVSQKRDEIIQAIKQNQVIIICGETGSGKTTQLPKMCLDAGLGIRGMIGHTQPRRLAARSVANRIAEELKTESGRVVGYKVRFSDTLGENALIKLMTDGILLSETHHDAFLNQYDCIIVDEAHERSLNIDFLLGYLKRLISKRHDLKIIITSATIDPQRFSTHFNDAPIIEVSGRTYPVDVEYRDTESEDGESKDLTRAIADCVDEISRYDRGDILVFLSGERDIREAADYLTKQQLHNTEILPLLARLSAAEQNKIFRSSGKRRIILSTNVAETSLTVPGIKYVIDTGLARISRYSWRSKIQRLPIEKISQASANQRKGRCGRVSAGVCFRLYSEDDFNLRKEFTEPEIQRTNLAAVILQMEHMQLGHVEDFPFVESPDSRLITDGYKLLHELGAIDHHHKITNTGKQLARLPIDPKLGRILIESVKENCLIESLIIVSALSVQDPRERPLNKQQAADEAHKKFSDNKSDFISWLNLWKGYHTAKYELSGNQLRKWCKEHYISWLRMREWIDTHRQIKKMSSELRLKPNTSDADYNQIHRALITGFLSQLGFKEEGHEYQGCRQRKFHIFPGSGLFNKGPKWVVASDIVETQKVYARHLAKIEPQWIADKARHLIKHSYTESHWEKKPAQVSAIRKSTLFGLLINPGVKINYGPINPAESREIFIRSALVQGDFDCKHDFYNKNRDLINEIEKLEAKSRRQDILVDDNDVYDFYDQRLPEDIYSGPQLNKWIKNNDSKKLLLSIDDLMKKSGDHVSDNLFPDTILINDIQFPLDYHFDPSHHCDGITLITPAAGLASLNSNACDWLVPGMLLEKMTELIRSLPKQLRKNFVPAPNFAEACLDALSPGTTTLTMAMSNHLKKITGTEIAYDAWQEAKLSDHLFFNYRVISADGKTLKQSRDLTKLQIEYSNFTDTTEPETKNNKLEQDDVDSSILDDLPDSIEINNNGIMIKAYPVIVASGKQVNVRIIASQLEAQKKHYEGIRQLFINALSQPVKNLKLNLKKQQNLCAKYISIGSCEQFKSQVIHRIIDHLFTRHMPTTQNEFTALLDNRKHIDDSLTDTLSKLSKILDLFHQLNKKLKNPPLNWLDAMTDIQNQLNHLLHNNFILKTHDDNLNNYTRYLNAIDKRLEKIQANPERDRKARLEISSLWEDYKKRSDMLLKNNQKSEQLEQYRWLLEEYRISLFAQEIKTISPVSAKRLKKIWNDISDA